MHIYEPTKKFLTLSLAAAIFSLAGIAVITWVLFAKISMINKEVAKTRQMNVSVEQAFKIKGQLNEAETKLNALDSFFLQPGEEVKFIEKLESLASTTKVKLDIQTISVDSKGESKSKSSFKDDLAIALQAQGGREELLSFLKAVESLPKAVSVDRADLALNESEWNLRLNLVIYKLK